MFFMRSLKKMLATAASATDSSASTMNWARWVSAQSVGEDGEQLRRTFWGKPVNGWWDHRLSFKSGEEGV